VRVNRRVSRKIAAAPYGGFALHGQAECCLSMRVWRSMAPVRLGRRANVDCGCWLRTPRCIRFCEVVAAHIGFLDTLVRQAIRTDRRPHGAASSVSFEEIQQ
jgi:hypothetical protein